MVLQVSAPAPGGGDETTAGEEEEGGGGGGQVQVELEGDID